MFKISFFTIFLTLVVTRVQAQISSTATASTSASIINLIGTENSSSLMKGSFNPGLKSGIVEINNNGITVGDRVGFSIATEKVELPSFRVLCDQSTYSITLAYNPIIINKSASDESIRIESLQILTDPGSNEDEKVSRKYSIGALISVGPSQLPGLYSAGGPCAVTINYN